MSVTPPIVYNVNVLCSHCCKETLIRIPADLGSRVRTYACNSCFNSFPAQFQNCRDCKEWTIVTSLQCFDEGVFTCKKCYRVNKIEPWVRYKVEKTAKKANFWLKLLKRWFKKGPVLAYDSSLTCPTCKMDSVFWEIGNGARKICSMCDKEIVDGAS